MSDTGYYGSYANFTCPDRKAAPALMNSDNIVGDPFTIEMDYSGDKRQAWIVNPFGFRMGVLDEKTAKQVDLCNAKDWKTVALLACVAFKEEPKPGEYWGQVAIISYDPVHEDAFSTFVKTIGGISRVLESKGAWVPTGRVPLPKLKKGSAFIKTERTTTDKLVNQARKTRVGCTIVSWGVVIIFVITVIFAMKSCGMF